VCSLSVNVPKLPTLAPIYDEVDEEEYKDTKRNQDWIEGEGRSYVVHL
jgi:hypothetical protein